MWRRCGEDGEDDEFEECGEDGFGDMVRMVKVSLGMW